MKGHCAYCGCEITLSEMQVDHVMPLRKGGPDTLENMLPACRSCNHYKSTLTVQQFRDTVERMPYRLMKNNATFRNAVRFGQGRLLRIYIFFRIEERRGFGVRRLFDRRFFRLQSFGFLGKLRVLYLALVQLGKQRGEEGKGEQQERRGRKADDDSRFLTEYGAVARHHEEEHEGAKLQAVAHRVERKALFKVQSNDCRKKVERE